MKQEEQDKLNELKNLIGEESNDVISNETINNDVINEKVEQPQIELVKSPETTKTSLLDGYLKIDKSKLPQHGALYPESWEFAYRCPTAKEIANFSTINEMDQPGIIVAVEELIRKCVVIFDTDRGIKINSGEICDAHRTFWLLLIRSFYLPDAPVKINSICTTCQEQYDAILDAHALNYRELNDKLLSAYDGRIFTLNIDNNEVKFRVPTLETTGRIFKYIVKAYRNTNNGNEDKKDDKLIFDKQFLLIAPYLFLNGNETMRDIMFKYKAIVKNDSLFRAYLTVVNRLKLDNKETFVTDCPNCGSSEETMITFPGGWKKLFISNTDSTGYFD